MVTKRTEELKGKSAAHVFHAFGMVVDKPEIIWEKGKGVTLWDTDGKEYLDICSFFQCCNLGYGRKELHDAALEQMNQLEYATTISPYGNIPTIEYATELAKVTPKNINRFFFNTGGTEANETAFKIAKFYWYMKGKPTKYKIICLKDAYHGSGFLTGSLSGWVNMRNYTGPEAAGVVRIPNYNCYRPSPGFEGPDGVIKAAKYLETAIDQEGEDSVAAFITEPEQGWAGGIPAPLEYFPIIREICTRRNVLWIDDEVMAGFCRTGKMFAVEHWNLEPDIMTMGKGIVSEYVPFGAVGVSNEVFSVFRGQIFAQGMTCYGHPVPAAVAKAALDVYLKERICEHVTEVGNHVKERLEREFLPLPNVGNVAGMGLFLSIEIVADKDTQRKFPPEKNVMYGIIRQKCWEAGLFPRVYGSQFSDRLFFTPPLIITKEEADRALDLLYPIIAGLKDLKY